MVSDHPLSEAMIPPATVGAFHRTKPGGDLLKKSSRMLAQQLEVAGNPRGFSARTRRGRFPRVIFRHNASSFPRVPFSAGLRTGRRPISLGPALGPGWPDRPSPNREAQDFSPLGVGWALVGPKARYRDPAAPNCTLAATNLLVVPGNCRPWGPAGEGLHLCGELKWRFDALHPRGRGARDNFGGRSRGASPLEIRLIQDAPGRPLKAAAAGKTRLRPHPAGMQPGRARCTPATPS